MPDGDGTMLDHSLIMYGSNMSNSNAHDHYPLPTALVGRLEQAQGRSTPELPRAHAAGQLLLTVLDRAGVPMDKIGDSTGKFAEV